jgi:hypothetical protein
MASLLRVETREDAIRKAMREKLSGVATRVVGKYVDDITTELIKELAAEASKLAVDLRKHLSVQTMGQEISIHVRIG